MFCSQCGARLAQSARFCQGCGASRGPGTAFAAQGAVMVATAPSASTSAAEPAVVSRVMDHYAGFWRRVIALCVDAFIVGVIAEFLATDRASTFWLMHIVGLVYGILLEGMAGATLGKAALGVVVTGADGKRISFGQAVVRNVGKLLSLLFAGLPCVLVAFNGRKQGLHDLAAGSFVTIKR